MNFKDKTVLITGGSRGIGRAVVGEFSNLGAKVFFTYNKNDEAAQAVSNEYGATALKCPQNDWDLIESTVDSIVKENGSIDVLVNNAGITSDKFIMIMTFEEWQKVLDTNLSGAFRWAKAVSRTMINERQGAIINVASVAGLVGIGGQTNYAASKGGLLAFNRALAAELGPKGVRVNAVVPGFIETDMTAVMSRGIKRSNLERIIMKRFGKCEEIAGVVTFLASDKASYVTGQKIVVDGGLTGTVA